MTTPLSKIGGKPFLSPTQKWPTNESGKSLSFIGQLNFEQLSRSDRSGLLPRDGLLSFFYCADQEAWGFDPKDRHRFKLIYTAGSDGLEKRDLPGDLEEHARFTANRVEFRPALSLPGWEEDRIEGLIQDEDSDNYSEVSTGSNNQILGYANNIQGPMELECQLVTNGINCGKASGYEDPRRAELERGKNEWILLLQIDSEDDKTGMMWGDAGRLYFWIRKQDLINKDFDRAWFILQCY